MTTSPEPADDGQIPPQENVPASDQPAVPVEPTVPAVPSSEMPDVSGSNEGGSLEGMPVPEDGNTDEGLPDWEPLTPELVEDEAIRGDFVIRWAVVGLALLFGFSQINETRTLIHVRTGEYLASHGFLPPAGDVFSYTASGRRWVNLPWLFDLCAAGFHAAAGGIGLTIFQGLLVGLAFGALANVHRPDIRTWWGSICATLALIVCYPQFTVQPELITLVGLSALLWIVVQADEVPGGKILWLAVPVVWIWSQLDPRAFLGWFLLLAMAAGQALRRGEDAANRRRLWIQVALVAFAVAAIHPFLWESWLSPVRLYTADYPAMRQVFPNPLLRGEVSFQPITSELFWKRINHDSIAAFVLLGATIVTMFLNRERLNPGHVISVILFNSIACLAVHEWAAASLVNCMVSTVNAQTWYRHRFGQIYSIDWRELLFSRGGRAITVICLFVLAWTVISGRIDGPGGKRTGIGFDENLLTQMDSYREVAARSFDDRPFHFSARQGDLVIWVGQKSFIDSRGSLFSGKGESDLLGLHDSTRKAIRAALQPANSIEEQEAPKADNKVWKETFAKYNITHAMPRLSGPVPPPDYLTFFELLFNKDEWVLTDLRSATATFYRNVKDGPLAEFLADKKLDLVKSAFEVSSENSKTPTAELLQDTIHEIARPATTYDNLFSLRQPKHPSGIQEATHYLQIGLLNKENPPLAAACAIHAVRRATAGLRDDSNSVEGYRVLATAYRLMDDVEAKLLKGTTWFSTSRYFQTVAALRQAAALRPDDLGIQFELLALYGKSQRREFSLEVLRQIKRLRPPLDTPELRKKWEPFINEEFELVERLSRIEEAVNQQLQNGAERFDVAAAANQAGAVRLAIRILEEDAIYKEERPQVKNVLAAWLLEAGRIQEALDILDTVEQSGAMLGIPGWRDTVATGMLVTGDYSHAIRLWRDQIQDDSANSAGAVLATFPFQALNPISDQFPAASVAAVSEALVRVRGEAASLKYKIAMAQLELGDNVGAAASLTRFVEETPQSQLIPIIKFYLDNLTDGKSVVEPKAAPVIEEFEPLTEESGTVMNPATPEDQKNKTDGVTPQEGK